VSAKQITAEEVLDEIFMIEPHIQVPQHKNIIVKEFNGLIG